MSSRTNRPGNAQETLRILEDGRYRTPTGEEVVFGDELAYALERSFHIEPDGFPEFDLQWRKEVDTHFEVVNETIGPFQAPIGTLTPAS